MRRMKDEGTRARPQTLAVQHLPLPGASPGCARPLAKGNTALALLLMLNSSGCCGASALGRCSNPPARHRVVPTPRSVWMDVCYGCCRCSWFCVPCDAALRCGCSAAGAVWCARELQRALCTCVG